MLLAAALAQVPAQVLERAPVEASAQVPERRELRQPPERALLKLLPPLAQPPASYLGEVPALMQAARLVHAAVHQPAQVPVN
mmetsp:Transcript_46920/g.149815  ORF Transcript_46920/g.149815 Transcript_46920/m.149815 type:complete len:82 (-) Transcript_46920:16-261(-)